MDDETVISNNGEFSFSVQETFNVSSSDLDDEVEVVYDCSDILRGCSTVRHCESRTLEAHVSLSYYMGCRYHDSNNVLSVSKFPSHSFTKFCCHESRLSSKSSMMSIPRRQAGRSATALVR
jgi:hypothetical protein